MATTRWLNQDEQRTWRTFMLAAKLLQEQLDRELDQGTDVPSPYYEVLVRLSEAPGRRLRLSDLADRVPELAKPLVAFPCTARGARVDQRARPARPTEGAPSRC